MKKKILLLTDNEFLLDSFKKIIQEKKIEKKSNFSFEYAFSPNNKKFIEKYISNDWIKPIDVKSEENRLINEYFMIFSLHCKQIFPIKLLKSVKCINIHPGLNPHNRGWFPQVFSIINSLPCGATIHEIDEQLDHGPIICQKKIQINSWDTSFTLYNKIIEAEIELLTDNIEDIINLRYNAFLMKNEGNLNLKKDFDKVCNINLDNVDTFKNHINKLRALTHNNYLNAYFIDEQGNKVYIKVELNKN